MPDSLIHGCKVCVAAIVLEANMFVEVLKCFFYVCKRTKRLMTVLFWVQREDNFEETNVTLIEIQN